MKVTCLDASPKWRAMNLTNVLLYLIFDMGPDFPRKRTTDDRCMLQRLSSCQMQTELLLNCIRVRTLNQWWLGKWGYRCWERARTAHALFSRDRQDCCLSSLWKRWSKQVPMLVAPSIFSSKGLVTQASTCGYFMTILSSRDFYLIRSFINSF